MNVNDNSFPVVVTGEIGGATVQTVNARDLHAFLMNGDMFANWIKARIGQYDFQEGRDFATYLENTKKGRPAVEYAVTIDMAKELAMVERNEQGKRAREYFIDCERRAKAVDPVAALNDPNALRGLLLQNVEKVLALEAEKAELTPKAEALDLIATADGSLCITDAAKHLGVAPKDLFRYLRENQWIYRRAGTAHDVAYQAKVLTGLMEHKITVVHTDDGREKVRTQARITPKGLARLAGVFVGEGA